MRPFGPWVIACSALLGFVAAIYGFWQRGLQIAELSGRMEQAESRADARIGELQAKLTAAEKARVVAERAAKESRLAAAAPGAAVGPRAVTNPLNLSEMRKDPAYAAIWRKQQLRNIQRQYGDAFAALKLPPDQLAKLKDLLVTRNDANLDASEAAQEAGLTGRDVSLAIRNATNSVNDEIKALIGDDKFTQLQTTPQTSMAKTMLENTVAVDLEGAGQPLNSDQLASLAAIYNQTQRQPPAGAGQGWQTPDPQTGLAPVDEALLNQASQSLTPAQLPILRDYLLEVRQQQQYMQKRLAAARGGGG
jgi:hypothetical protein